MKINNSLFLIIFILIAIFVMHITCLEDMQQVQIDGDGLVAFSINLTKAMIDALDITYVRITVYQNSDAVWGPENFTVDQGGATIDGLPAGHGYHINAEALDSGGTEQCDGQSAQFSVVAGQTTQAGNIELDCLPTPTATSLYSPTPTPTPTSFYSPTPTPTSLYSPTPTYTPGGTNAGDVYAIDNIVGTLRYVPAGVFIQGSPTEPEEPCRQNNETQFTHTLTRSFAVMETEVTRQMWADLEKVQSSLPVDPTHLDFGSGMNNPVQDVSWYETVLFANLLSVQNGLTVCYYANISFTVPIDDSNYNYGTVFCNFDAPGYRLLTEGEWEYAARAGTTGPYSLTENNYNSSTCGSCTDGTLPTLELYAVFCANNYGETSRVKSKFPNPWNLSDMHGNVWEWCWDWYALYPGGAQENYSGDDHGTTRVDRGGGWFDNPDHCRSAYRISLHPGDHSYNVGFRLTRTVN